MVCVAAGRGVRRAMLFLLLGLSACFSFQATPAVNPSLPFSLFFAFSMAQCFQTMFCSNVKAEAKRP
jgi:hypothetical protein